MSDLRELYQEVILDHNKRPRNFRVIDPCSHHADGYNPLCGDNIRIYAQIDDGIISDVAFQGSGCAISTASASMMTDAVKGKSVAEAESMFEEFHNLVKGESADSASLGKSKILAGVRDYPSRVKCATLSWHALHLALEEGRGSVSNEGEEVA